MSSLLDSKQVMAECSEYALVLMMFLLSPFLMLYDIALLNTMPPDIYLKEKYIKISMTWFRECFSVSTPLFSVAMVGLIALEERVSLLA